MHCPACGYYNPQGQETCFHCGLSLPRAAGTDAKCATHLDLAAVGACSRCGTFGCASCLTQRDQAWLCAACLSRLDTLPWDERERLGLWRAWWQTSVRMISSPTQTLSTVEADAPVGSSVLYALLSALVGFLPTVAIYALVLIPAFLFAPSKADAEVPLKVLGPVLVVFYVVLLFATQVAGLFISAGLDHLALLVLGAKPRSFSVSLRAGALAMGPYLLGLMPFCSLYVYPLWALVLRVMALMHLHKTTAGLAAAAVFLPLVLLCGAGAGLIALIFAAGL